MLGIHRLPNVLCGGSVSGYLAGDCICQTCQALTPVFLVRCMRLLQFLAMSLVMGTSNMISVDSRLSTLRVLNRVFFCCFWLHDLACRGHEVCMIGLTLKRLVAAD